MPRLVLARAIAPQIIEECQRFEHTETGSVLLGRTTCDDQGRRLIQIDLCLPADEGSQREWAAFSQASLLHEELLRWYQARHPTIRYLGDWHKHPDGAERPSGGDLMTARQMLDDSDFGLDELLVVIACRRSRIWCAPPPEPWWTETLRGSRIDPRGYSIRFFYLARGMRQFAELKPVAVAPEDRRLPDARDQWYAVDGGRLKSELALLDAIGALYQLRIAGGRPHLWLHLHHACWRNRLLIATPRHYPHQAPWGRAARGSVQQPFNPWDLGLSWNPDRNLAQLLYAALAHGLHTRDVPTNAMP